MKELQEKLIKWAAANFNRSDTVDPLLGAVEELGELSHAYLKRKQGIRTNEDHIENMKDAVGDITIYLIDFCDRMGWSFTDIVHQTAEKVVLKRNWKDNKETGA